MGYADNTGYINVVAVMQKFFILGISGNWSYNLRTMIIMKCVSVMAKDLLNTYKYGWKTSYYQNTMDGKVEDVIQEHCPRPFDDDGEDCDAVAFDAKTIEYYITDEGRKVRGRTNPETWKLVKDRYVVLKDFLKEIIRFAMDIWKQMKRMVVCIRIKK